MPVSKSLSTAVRDKGNSEVLGADSIAICPSVGSVVSVSKPLGTGKDKTFADRPEADCGDGERDGRLRVGFIGEVFCGLAQLRFGF